MKKNSVKPSKPYQTILPDFSQTLKKSIRHGLRRIIPQGAKPEPEYHLIQEKDFSDQIFQRLKQSLFYSANASNADNQEGPGIVYFKESGRLEPGRLYFYLKKSGQQGWLFERSGIGWLVTRCEKISERDLFLRLEEPTDIVTAFFSKEKPGSYRISSELMGGELISFLVYERLMARQIFGAIR